MSFLLGILDCYFVTVINTSRSHATTHTSFNQLKDFNQLKELSKPRKEIH